MDPHHLSADSAGSQPRPSGAQILELARRSLPTVEQRQREHTSATNRLTAYLKACFSELSRLVHCSCFTIDTPPHDELDVKFLAQGGYNDVWLVTKSNGSSAKTVFILRVSTGEALNPYQTRNEVAWLRYLAEHCPQIPLPDVYDYCDGSDPGTLAFIAEEYVEAKTLSDLWMAYSKEQKEAVAGKIAELIVRVGELRFHHIGGLTPPGIAGPTVEGHKLFKGRSKYHRHACYDIGPYCSTKQYILAQYDKEIFYHSHADASMLDASLYEKTSALEFAEKLKMERAEAQKEMDSWSGDEPFVLCHNDLQGRNIMMKGTEIAAVVDWKFAGSFPLSEFNNLGLDVVEYDSDAHEEENRRWGSKIGRELVPKLAAERGWSEQDIALLTSGGKAVIQAARTVMFPRV